MSADDNEGDDVENEDTGDLTAQTLWDSRAVTWAVASQAHERSRRQRFLTKKWPLPLFKLPALGGHGEVRPGRRRFSSRPTGCSPLAQSPTLLTVTLRWQGRVDEDEEVTEEHVAVRGRIAAPIAFAFFATPKRD